MFDICIYFVFTSYDRNDVQVYSFAFILKVMCFCLVNFTSQPFVTQPSGISLDAYVVNIDLLIDTSNYCMQFHLYLFLFFHVNNLMLLLTKSCLNIRFICF